MTAYKFEPYLKSVIWGGDKIKRLKGIDTQQQCIGESWEVSGVSGHESIVAEGEDQGMSLPALIEKYKGALVGEEVYRRFGSTFPLLVKIIDAKQNLSVQVHPDDALAMERHQSLGKTEMWYLIDSEPGATIYSGLSKSITPDEYVSLVRDNRIMEAIAAHEAKPGDVFFLPAGRIHAIGAGCLLAEIQETSDITYRIYDYDRRDAQGRPRELHTELAKDAIDYTVYPSYKLDYDRHAPGETQLVDCSHFTVDVAKVQGELQLSHSPQSFTIAICMEGECQIDVDGQITPLSACETILIPAAAGQITAHGHATLLTARIKG